MGSYVAGSRPKQPASYMPSQDLSGHNLADAVPAVTNAVTNVADDLASVPDETNEVSHAMAGGPLAVDSVPGPSGHSFWFLLWLLLLLILLAVLRVYLFRRSQNA